MKKQVTPKRDQYTVALEDLRSQFKVFGENLSAVDKKLDDFRSEVDSRFETVFDYLSRIDDELTDIRNELKEIKKDLLHKTEVARVEKLELRVAYLEKELAKR